MHSLIRVFDGHTCQLVPFVARWLITQLLTDSMMIYSRTSMAQTLMAHSPWLARNIILVHTGQFMHNPPWMAGTTLG